jgi:hypothetical protein
MKKIIIVSTFFFLLASCSTQKPLYSWEKYEDSSYNYLKDNNEEATQELIENFQKIIKEQKGSRGIVPPGIYADYGFILLQLNKTEEGKKLLQKEVSLYPESKIFIDRILKILE